MPGWRVGEDDVTSSHRSALDIGEKRRGHEATPQGVAVLLCGRGLNVLIGLVDRPPWTSRTSEGKKDGHYLETCMECDFRRAHLYAVAQHYRVRSGYFSHAWGKPAPRSHLSPLPG
jgi:hypothetical protein